MPVGCARAVWIKAQGVSRGLATLRPVFPGDGEEGRKQGTPVSREARDRGTLRQFSVQGKTFLHQPVPKVKFFNQCSFSRQAPPLIGESWEKQAHHILWIQHKELVLSF